MEKKDFEQKCWGGVKARVIGKCKYCKNYSFAEMLLIDEVDGKPYHEHCKEKIQKEANDNTQNMV